YYMLLVYWAKIEPTIGWWEKTIRNQSTSGKRDKKRHAMAVERKEGNGAIKRWSGHGGSSKPVGTQITSGLEAVCNQRKVACCTDMGAVTSVGTAIEMIINPLSRDR